ncbi:uncharacterized protein LOC102358289 [Latimeria chalumnae]|uniref:Uncharacterized protein n=1 Tax=Latimeria chalumnae TaxID=7897 RepID=M3XJD4_LATCH
MGAAGQSTSIVMAVSTEHPVTKTTANELVNTNATLETTANEGIVTEELETLAVAPSSSIPSTAKAMTTVTTGATNGTLSQGTAITEKVTVEADTTATGVVALTSTSVEVQSTKDADDSKTPFGPSLSSSPMKPTVSTKEHQTTLKPAGNVSGPSNMFWILISVGLLFLVVIVALMITFFRRKRKQQSHDFQSGSKKKKKQRKGEDAWAGPVPFAEDQAMPEDPAEQKNDSGEGSKTLPLSTFFAKRKSRATSVILEDVKVQPVEDGKETQEATQPLLTKEPNGQALGNNKEDHQDPTPLPEGSQVAADNTEEPKPNGLLTTADQGAPTPPANGQLPPPIDQTPEAKMEELDLPPPPAEEILLTLEDTHAPSAFTITSSV